MGLLTPVTPAAPDGTPPGRSIRVMAFAATLPAVPFPVRYTALKVVPDSGCIPLIPSPNSR
jgi:hypothetical protein